MNAILSLFITLLFVGSMSAQESLEGTWSTGEDDTKVETYQKDGKWYGKIISSGNPKAKMGMDILIGFEKTAGVWEGKVYAPKRDKMLDATLKRSEDQLVITVAAGLIKKTLKWKKVASKP